MRLSEAYKRVRHAIGRDVDRGLCGVAVYDDCLTATDGHRLVMAPLDRGDLEGKGLEFSSGEPAQGLLDGDPLAEPPERFPRIEAIQRVTPKRQDGGGEQVCTVSREDIARVKSAIGVQEARLKKARDVYRGTLRALNRAKSLTKAKSDARKTAEKEISVHKQGAPPPWPVIEIRVRTSGLEVQPGQTAGGETAGWVAINGRYLLQALKAARGDARLQTGSVYAPVRLDDGEGAVEAIMPVRPAKLQKTRKA